MDLDDEHERRAFADVWQVAAKVRKAGGPSLAALLDQPSDVWHYDDGGVGFGFEGGERCSLVPLGLLVIVDDVTVIYGHDGLLRSALPSELRGKLDRLRRLAATRAANARWC